MTVGLTIMRLQPLHNGHINLINSMLDENEKSILMLGSVGVIDENNPYSYEERLEMVKTVYQKEMESGKLFVGGLKDIHNLPKWVDYVKSHLPFPADIYYCGIHQNAKQFAEKGFSIRLFDRPLGNLSGTLIRQKIRDHDSSWENDVPFEIIPLIKRKDITR